jgi:uncharacterized integral membrane protein
MPAKKIILLAIIFMLLLLIIQNLDIIKIDVLFWLIRVSLLLIILLPFILGTVLGWILKSPYSWKKKSI